MRHLVVSAGAGWALAVAGIAAAQTATQRVDIQRFEVIGNTLLPQAKLNALLDPYTGKQRELSDVRRAQEALEAAYRADGYGTVRIALPEQDTTAGVVRLQVVEVTLGAIQLSGNKHYSDANVRRGLPALQTGATPNLRVLSENVALSNERASKQVEVVLAAGQAAGTVDAKVIVTDESPQHIGFTLDNTGSKASGRWRLGASYVHENLFDLDHAASLAYTTSPDSPSGVQVDVFSVGYRAPLYQLGDSVELIYGKSTTNTPSSTPSLGGALDLVGKGEVIGLHLNHNFARSGETTSKLVVGLDYTHVDTSCTTVDGQPVSTEGPTPPIASCVPYTVMPLKLTYASATRGGSTQSDFGASAAVNIPSGASYTNISGRTDRYSYLTAGNRDTRDHYVILRAGGSMQRSLDGDWQLRVAASAQYAFDPTVAAESLGLTGSNAVRGFDERALMSDSGAVVNAELYTPNLGAAARWNGSLQRGLVFIDAAHGLNHSPNTIVPRSVSPASVGLGLRAAIGKTANLRVDVARVVDAGSATGAARGDVKAHVLLAVSI